MPATMMRPGNALLLLLLAIFSALLPHASPHPVSGGGPPNSTAPGNLLHPPVDSRVIPFCNKTNHPKVCVNSARFYSHNYQAINSTSMFNITVQALRDRISTVRARATAMSKNHTWNPMVLKGFNECLGFYDDALDGVNNGVAAFAARDRGTFATRFSAVITMFSTCDDAFMESLNPLQKRNDRLSNLASNCIAIGLLSFN